MKHDPIKLRQLRESMGMTQEKLAILSNVSERTVQRAEAGATMRLDTLSDFAAALEVPLSELATDAEDFAGGNDVSLRRIRTGRPLLDELAKAGVAILECDVDPSSQEVEALIEIVRMIEQRLPEPWEFEQRPAMMDLSERIVLAAQISKSLAVLDGFGIALFGSSSWINARYPRYDMDEGHRYTRVNQPYERVQTMQLLLTRGAEEKIYRKAPDEWSLEVEPPRVEIEDHQALRTADDLDDDVPF